ncbi:MAG TPA: prolyl oligopeptidase family serine peptidase [Lacunisphaera sp.]|nr:prolyl oligopeptidase family serine peptidase [Lacunisphaera sp.]
MHRIFRRGFLVAVACGGLVPSPELGGRELPPAAAFTKPVECGAIKLRPDGGAVAIIGVRDYIDYLSVVDLATMQLTYSQGFRNGEIDNFWWKGPDRIVILARSNLGYLFFKLMDLRGEKNPPESQVGRTVSILDPLPADPDNMIIMDGMMNVARFNFRTGKSERIEKHQDGVDRWILGENGTAAAAFGWGDGTWFMLTRASRNQDWHRVSLGTRSSPDFWPVAMAADQRRIVGWDQVSHDTAQVVIRDPATGRDEPILHAEDVDPSQNLFFGDRQIRLRGVIYETDRPHAKYFQREDAALADSIDRALPGTFNEIVSLSADENRVVIERSSDATPPAFYLLDRAAHRLVPLGSSRPGLDPQQLATARFIPFTARDGLPLTARILLPPNAGAPPPLLVAAVGRLGTRTSASFQPYLQLLASRGYAILGVNHRGVSGFGQKVAHEGIEQVDGRMADDLADAVDAVIKTGWVDRTRVAIMGEDEAGILAVYALARHPALFSAWINVNTPMEVGVLDPAALAFGQEERIGLNLPAAEEFKLRRYSNQLNPAEQLKEVRIASFHYYDRRVDGALLYSGDRAQKAMARTGLPLTFLTAPYPSHWSNDTATYRRQRFEEDTRLYAEVLKFLGRQFPTPDNQTGERVAPGTP